MVVLLSVSVVSAASTDFNNTTQKSNRGTELLGDSSTGSLSDLRQNISDAGSTLNLTKNYVYNSSTDSSVPTAGIELSKPIIIDGNGYTIDANNFGRIFNINASDVILKNIIFINSHYAGKGGAIFVCQGNTGIIFDNCSFIDNYAEEGSGIYSNSPINMSGSNFTHNGYDASSYSLNGGAVFINAMAYIEGSYFYNNAASYGGAIYASSRVKISNSNFNSNNGNLGGGAIYFDKNSNNNIISGSNFLSNTASSTNANGSAIHFDGNNNTVLDSYFNNNINTGGYGGAIFANDGTSKLTVIGSTFTNNQAVRRGGAIDAHTSYLTIFNSTFKSNKITGSGDTYGSAINLVGSRALINQSNFEDHTASSGTIYGTINFSSNYGSIFNCTFNNNKATDGGAVRIYSTTHHVNISNCRFTNNQATNHGGAIAWAGSNGILNNSYFEANKVSGGHYYGGAVYAEVTSFKILNNDFRSNLAQTGGYGGAMFISSDDVELIKCNFSDNQAVGHDGGAILFDMGKKNFIVDECRFMRNYASWLSSAISCFATNVTIKNSYFNGNHNSYKADSGGYGGAVAFKYQGYNKVINCTFESNQNYYGGDIKVHDSSPNIEIYNCKFKGSRAYDGGAINLQASNHKIINCTFDALTADDNGGCIKNGADNVEIKNCSFSNSVVSAHDGGAIYFDANKNNLTVSDCYFYNNYAKWIGSAMALFGNQITVKNSTFIQNHNSLAQSSGGDWYGGAIGVRFTNGCNIYNCTFTGNKNYGGGAIRIHTGVSNVVVSNSTFMDNEAITYGGAFYSDTTGVKVNNCIFIRNKATNNHGGAIYSHGASFSVTTSLFVSNNAASGGAFFAYNTGHVIRDSIFLGNIARSTGYIISSADGTNRVDANYNWFGNVVGNKTVKPKVYDSGIMLTKWYFLDIDVNEQFLFTNGTSNVTFSLNRYYDSSTGNVVKGNFKYPDIVNLEITSTNDILGFDNITLDENKEYPTQTIYIPEIGVYTFTAKYMGVTATNSIYYVPPDSFTALNRTISLNYNNNLVLNHSYRYYDEYDFLFLGTGITIKKPINIDGNCSTIDAKNKVRIFYVESDNVTLSNLNFVNGHADNGGAIYWNGKNGILINSNFNAHSTTSSGGAILWNGAYGSINLCNFTNNYANGLSWTGGAICWIGQYGLINNTNFKNNSAIKFSSNDGGDGGALAVHDKYFVVDYCNFTENHCSNGGGAIGLMPSSQYVNITNSIFTKNDAIKSGSSSAQGAGGALYSDSADFLIYNCSFINNFASNNAGAIRTSARGNVLSSIFFNNTSPTGSALYASASGVVISDCIILNNKATSSGYIVSSDISGRVTANGNWWGNTINNQKTRPAAYSGVTVSNWYFLNIETSGKYFFTDEICNITYRLDQITTSNGVVTQRKLLNNLPEYYNFTATIGDLDSYSAILNDSTVVNNTFVSHDVGICTLAVTALGVTASTKVYYVPPDSFMALNMTIERNYGTNLNLTHGYQYYADYDFELLNTGVIINKPINITGNGYTLNAKTKLRVFKLSADNVHLDGLNYINGYAAENGGLIHVTGNNVVISNSNFSDSSAYKFSGAIHIDAKNASVINSIFKNNKIRVTGKNYYGGGAIAVSNIADGSSVIGCKFINNYAYISGGAILWDGPNGRIEDTYFEANNAKTYDGGAIQIRNTAVNMVINNITAYKNHDGGYGSVISAFADNILINNSRFLNNDYNNARNYGGTVHFGSTNARIYNSYFENNRAYSGGAITTLSANNIIQNVTFVNNRAVNLGGAINVQGSPANVAVSDCTFIGNYAGGAGGAIRVTSTNAQNFKLTNSIFKDNHAYNYGGAVSIQTANAVINNTYFDNNYVNKQSGGAIDLNGNNIIVDNSTFNNNRGIYGGGIAWYKPNGKLINSVFTNNYATGHDGGGLCVFSGATNMYICNVTMNNNRAKYPASALQTDATGTTIVNSSFTSNTNVQNSYGGAICFYKSGGIVSGCNFTSNNNYYGGAIYTTRSASTLLVENSNFVNNYARASGGAIHISKNNKLTLRNCNFTGNSAKNSGGDLVIYGANSDISNCNFAGGSSPIGGSITIAATVTVSNSNFTTSTASNRGGAISIEGYAKILNCNFNNTKSTNYGGAIYAASANSIIKDSNFSFGVSKLGGSIYIATVANILNNKFSDNSALNQGGALYVNAKNTVINSSEFNRNNAAKAGGAIYLAVTDIIFDSNFTENTAGTYGGAIYVASADSKLIGDMFNLNNATIDGGALYVAGKNLLINQSVFNQNGAVNGPGIYWAGVNGKLFESVLDNHTTDGLGTIYAKGNDLTITLTNMSFNTAKNGGALYVIGNNVEMIELNLINNTANFGGALYVNGANPTVTNTNFTNNRARYGAGMFVGNGITLNPSNFTNNVASKLGGAGYSYGFIDHVGTTLTYENWTTQTDNFYSAYVKLLNDTIFVGQTVILQLINETYTGNVTLEIANRSYNTTWINVTHRLADVSDLSWGIYSDIHAVYHATGSLHDEEFALVDLTVKRYPVNVTLVDNTTIVGGQLRVKVNETTATQHITIVFENGNEYTATINNNGFALIQLDDYIDGGYYNVTLLYSGDDYFDIGDGLGTIYIDKLNTTPSLELNWTYVDGEFIVILPDDATGEINITIGGKLYEAIVEGNRTVIRLDNLLKSDVYTNVKLSYSGNGKYNSKINTTVFEVFDYPVDIVLVDNITEVNSTLIFFFHAGDESTVDITGNISFIINGKTFVAPIIKEYDDTSGEGSVSYRAEVDISGLYGGDYLNVMASYISNNTYYHSTDVLINFTLTKLNSEIFYAGPEVLDLDRLMNFTLSENMSGNISFTYGGKLYNATIYDIVNATEGIINASTLPKGIYELVVSYNGDGYFKTSNTTVRFVVKDVPEIKLNSTGNFYENTVLNVNITSNVTGTVFVYVDGLKYVKINVTEFTDINTLFDVNLNNVSAGMHNITVEYLGDELHFNNTVSLELLISRANSLVNITNIVNATYNTTSVLVNFTVINRTSVYINVTNSKGESIYYNFTSENHIIFSNLDAGTYLITITNDQSLNYNETFDAKYFTVYKANTLVNVTGIVNGTYNTTNATVSFDVFNMTSISVIVYNNGTGIVVYNNTNFTGNTFTIGNLTYGIYNITIKNNETGNYNQYVESVLFAVYKAQTDITITNIVNGTYNTTNATVDFTITNRTNVTVIVYNNGTGVVVYNNTNFTGTSFTIGNLSAGVYNITIINAETDNLDGFNATVLFEVYKAKSLVNITNVVNATYNTTNVTVNFDVFNKTNITIIVYNATSSEVIKLTNYDDLQFVIGNLTSGVYNITINNMEHENYTQYTASALFSVYKAPSSVNITETINGIYNTTDVIVKFNITNRTDVKVVIIRNGTVVYNNTNFTAGEFIIGNLTGGIYNITITNLGNDNYYSSSDSALFTVFKVNSTVEILNTVNATYNTTNVEVQFSITNRTSVSIVIRNGTGDIVYSTDDFKGDLFSIGTLDAGNYNITITNNADENHNPSNDSVLFTVYKANSSLIITGASNSTYKVNNTIISLDIVNMTSISYIIYDNNGQIVDTGNASIIPLVLDHLNVGTYNITVINVENNNFFSSNDTATFSVIKSFSVVNITDIINGTLDESNATVKFDINIPTNVSIIVKDSNGNVVYSNPNFNGNLFSIGNLTTGVYNITILNAETDNVYASNDSGLFKVVVPTTIPSTNISRGYNSPYDYVATFTDEFGNKLNNTNVSMIVNGETYNLTTDENGVAYLNATLPVGVYEIKLVNPVSGENVTHTTTIVERLQENRDIVMDFCDGTHYRVRAYGDDGKPIEGVYVEITVNGVTYDVKTDKNGYALLKIRLNPNKFKITAEWKDYKINKIVVRQTLKAKSVKAKQSKNLKFSAALKWSSGKPIAGKKIVFKFRGKKYVAKTNKKGIATIKIKKSVLKKLKVGKKYHISITYNNIDNGYISVNNISKTIKIIK